MASAKVGTPSPRPANPFARQGVVLTLLGISPQFVMAVTVRGNVASPLQHSLLTGMLIQYLSSNALRFFAEQGVFLWFSLAVFCLFATSNTAVACPVPT
jgi:hypothetical protein